MNKRLIRFGYLTAESVLSYCPYCVQELRNEGRDYKEVLKPLKWVKTAEPILQKDKTYEDYYDIHYECSRCQNTRITPDTFSTIYGDYNSVLRSKRLPISGTFTIWNAEKRNWIKAKWDHLNQRYIPVEN